VLLLPMTALSRVVGCQEGHPACINLSVILSGEGTKSRGKCPTWFHMEMPSKQCVCVYVCWIVIDSIFACCM